MSFVGGCLDGRSVERRCASGGCRLFWGLVVGLGVRQLELRGSSFHPRQGLPRTRQTDRPMGWKFSLIGIPVESPPDSDTLAQRLGYSEFVKETPLERSLYPAPGLSFGFWNQVLLLCSEPLVERILMDDGGKERDKVLSLLPQGDVYVAQVHSVTDFYAFALFEEDRLIRRRVGCADEGDMIVEGQPFEWEATHQEDGWFDGEGAVFSFLAPLLGAPFDQAPDEFFETPFREYAKPKGKGLLSRLFGR